MSQQIMPNVSLGAVEVIAAASDMGNIEYLAIKEFEGKLRSDEGIAVAAGDMATLTATAGKDMYLAAAKCVIHTTPFGGASSNDQIVLKVNGVDIEKVKYSQLSSVGNATFEYEFKNIGHKVGPGQIIKMEALTIDPDTEAEGFIECFEEDTGTSPQVPPLTPV